MLLPLVAAAAPASFPVVGMWVCSTPNSGFCIGIQPPELQHRGPVAVAEMMVCA